MLGKHGDGLVNFLVHAARRIHVRDQQQARLSREIVKRAAMLDRRHRKRVLGVDPADPARLPDRVRALNVRAIDLEVPDRHRHVHRFDHHAALPMQDAQHVRDLEDVPECLDVAVTPAALEIRDVGRAGDRAEVDDIAADMQVPLAVARTQNEALGRMGEVRLDDVATKPDDIGGVVDIATVSPIDLAGARASDLEAALLHDPKSCRENALDLFLREHLHRRHPVHDPREGREAGPGRAGSAGSFAASGWRSRLAHGDALTTRKARARSRGCISNSRSGPCSTAGRLD